MGKDLYDHAPAARAVFDEAGEQVKSWCFEGTKEMLRMTQVTQPSIYTVTIAAYRALREAIDQHPALGETLEMEGIAGFSLGEYSALTAAGVIRDMAQGLDIVTRRGQLMNEAGIDIKMITYSDGAAPAVKAAAQNREVMLAGLKQRAESKVAPAPAPTATKTTNPYTVPASGDYKF